MKQWIQSSHIPPCHRHLVITTLSVIVFALLHRSANQTSAECCLEFTTRGGYEIMGGGGGAGCSTAQTFLREMANIPKLAPLELVTNYNRVLTQPPFKTAAQRKSGMKSLFFMK